MPRAGAHPNGVERIDRVYVAVPDVAVAAQTYGRVLGLPADVPVLLSVGRLVPRKGVDNVIRALGVLVRRLGVPAERVPFAPQKVERIDEVAGFFPELRILMKDGGEPCQALAVTSTRGPT